MASFNPRSICWSRCFCLTIALVSAVSSFDAFRNS